MQTGIQNKALTSMDAKNKEAEKPEAQDGEQEESTNQQ